MKCYWHAHYRNVEGVDAVYVVNGISVCADDDCIGAAMLLDNSTHTVGSSAFA